MKRTGVKPSFPKAIRAKCADCMGNYKDGRIDCEVATCSLYYFMPYRAKDPMWHEPPKRVLSANEQARMAKMRAKRFGQG